MKRAMSLALALVLLIAPLSGCRRRAAQEESTTEADNGPGYTITDGSAAQQEENSVPDPLNTPTPQEWAAMQLGESEEEPHGEPVSGSDLFAPIDSEGNPIAAEATQPPAPASTFYVVDTSTQVNPSTQVGAMSPQSYQYSAVMDDALDYTFNYPSHWEHIPGIYTVCYREVVEQGDFPARISICRKKLVHTPDDIAMTEQLTSYLQMVSEHYDPSTFQAGTPDREARFMGHQALSNTYLAFWGDIEIKGYVVGVAINRTLYVLHFCATYADYAAMENVLAYMVQSVALKEEEKKK